MYYWIFKMYNYDDLINYVGLSSYQIVIMICSSLMIWPSGLNNVAPMFLMETPPFHAQQAWLDQRVEFELGLNQFWWKVFGGFWPRQGIWPKKSQNRLCSKVNRIELSKALKRTARPSTRRYLGVMRLSPGLAYQ